MRPYLLLCFALSGSAMALPLAPVTVSITDTPSLQRGAKVFMNYCSGCHSLQYLRYQRLAKDLGVVDNQGRIATSLIKQTLIFSGDALHAPIRSAFPQAMARDFFGVVPPDLSVIAQVRGGDWLYTYLRSFYRDPTQPWGSNNALKPDVAMPNVLLPLQGMQIPVYQRNADGHLVIDHLVTIERGEMAPAAFNGLVADVVNFLVYVSEPQQLERQRLGGWVILYLVVLAGVLYQLQKRIWKRLER